ncbi:protease modulator HflC [Dongia soli]|uniref:Protein HflC n=1 Tax=Dongia soli TaxID=600628 RepID=A0ABU5ED65_9PROT|nr:protease modulator HflC [Dongia soli]MDY0884281.1 protease modulator HflC [Dongia soli]
MKRNSTLVAAIIAGVVILAGLLSIFQVPQWQDAIVLQFGKPVRVIVNQPGLHWRIPFVENVHYVDKRVLNFDAPAQELLTLDQKRIVISAYVRYQIEDPLRFYQVGRTEGRAEGQIGSVLVSALRAVIGNVSMTNILTPQRAELMKDITSLLTESAKPYGIRIVDVRFKRVDLPSANSDAVYNRMRTQRAQEARKIRAEGEREARELRAEADKQKVVTLAEARRQGEILRGEGDGEATRIYNDAFGKDPKFFDFYRSLQAMETGLGGNNTTFVGSPTGDFFRYFETEPGKPAQ